jgi:hypothetical protein
MKIRDFVQISECRAHSRLFNHFTTKLSKIGLFSSIEGVSEDLSQAGAFIKIKSWDSFQPHDKAAVIFLIPPSFSGQDKVIGLHGIGVITRVDQQREGIAVRFIKRLKQFERVDKSLVLALESTEDYMP